MSLPGNKSQNYEESTAPSGKSEAEFSLFSEREFVGVVSHEMRTPLASIRGYAEMLEEELEPQLQPHHKAFFQIIRSTSDRLLSLVNDLLDLSRIENDRIKLQLAAVRLPTIGREVIDTLFPFLKEKKDVVIEAGFGDDQTVVLADASRLRQVLLNVLSNAIKFTSAGVINVSVTSAEIDKKPAWAIEIEDPGCGISETFMPQLFTPFTQENPVSEPEGAGLGLTITRELVRKMGGTISASSEPGKGARFVITMPAAQA